MRPPPVAESREQSEWLRSADEEAAPSATKLPGTATGRRFESDSNGKMIYRGVEQLVARRAHNPEVVGSSPASATIK